MKAYDILDSELQTSVGVLLYYEKDDAFIIELQDDLTEWNAPLLFADYVKHGVFTVQREESRLWVKERIIPSGRQNIKDILTTHHMEKYEESKFLEISRGKSSQDNMHLQKTENLPEYVLSRQSRNLYDVVPLSGQRLLCMFKDKKTKVVSLQDLLEYMDIPKILANGKLFESCRVSPGGYAASFNDSIDIPAAKLYSTGFELPLTVEDFKTVTRKNILSTAEACSLLECTRQNIAYMVDQQQLKPLKKEESGSLYLKGELLQTRW